jgi:hypothetical protein
MKEEFVHARAEREAVGEIYRHIEQKFGEEASIELLDPRNLLVISSYFFRQVVSGKINVFRALVHFLLHIKREAIFVNGNYVDEKAKLDEVIFDQLQRK